MHTTLLYRQNHLYQKIVVFFATSTILLISPLSPPNLLAGEITGNDKCILHLISNGPDSMTIGEAKSQCDLQKTTHPPQQDPRDLQNLHAESPGAVNERLALDDKNLMRAFTLMSHHSNYLLAGAYNFAGWSSTAYEDAADQDIAFDNTELQFQLSIKTPLAIDLFDKNLDIFAAYTVRSFWQAYNSDISSPFRETNHQPEIWVQTKPDWEFFGIKNSVNILGMAHQSNGQAAELSRSWNRVYAGILLEKENIALLLKPWFRISEDESSDDNPDITDYLGHGEIHVAYKKEDHVFTLMSRNNLESGFSKGAVELGWSFPLFHYDYIKGYIQYFSGYGESLIDYNNYVNRIGFGILLTDVL